MYVQPDSIGPTVMAERRTQTERREATRAALIDAGKRLFAERGYAAVSAEELVAEAGVTRGALYHHFDGKRGLFAAVYEAVEADLMANFSLEDLVGEDPFGVLRAGARQSLDLSLDYSVQRIALIDAPAVLGWDEWHEVQVRHGLGLLVAGITAAIEAGQLRPLPIEELANALLGTLVEAALYVSRSADQDAARERMLEVLEAFLDGLRADQ
jgi:AcrR family transcriptional regulator